MKLLRHNIYDHLWESVGVIIRHQTRNKVYDHVWDQVRMQVLDQVRYRTWDEINETK